MDTIDMNKIIKSFKDTEFKNIQIANNNLKNLSDFTKDELEIFIIKAIKDSDPYTKTKINKKSKSIIPFVKDFIVEFNKQDFVNQGNYDEWYKTNSIKLHNFIISLGCKYGKTQKILNMTLKYLYCFTYEKDKFKYCHMPLDSYIFEDWFKNDILKWYNDNNQNRIYKKGFADKWSNIENYNDYIKIQNLIIDYISKNSKMLFDVELTPLQAEFYLWPYLKCRRAKNELIKQYSKCYNICYKRQQNELKDFTNLENLFTNSI